MEELKAHIFGKVTKSGLLWLMRCTILVSWLPSFCHQAQILLLWAKLLLYWKTRSNFPLCFQVENVSFSESFSWLDLLSTLQNLPIYCFFSWRIPFFLGLETGTTAYRRMCFFESVVYLCCFSDFLFSPAIPRMTHSCFCLQWCFQRPSEGLTNTTLLFSAAIRLSLFCFYLLSLHLSSEGPSYLDAAPLYVFCAPPSVWWLHLLYCTSLV